jgi:drug/metabolite transporter (DMT)-like permease
VIERSPHPLRHALPLFLVAGFCLSSLDATAKYLVRHHSLLTPFTYLQILWATAFGYLMFGQHPDRLSVLGMAVVVASRVALAGWERRRMRLL